MCGQADLTIGGGVESMSRVPMGSPGGSWMVDPSIAFKTYFVPQGISADLLATKYKYSRDDVDLYAVNSHKRASNAWKNKYFKKSIIDIHDQNGENMLNFDEFASEFLKHSRKILKNNMENCRICYTLPPFFENSFSGSEYMTYFSKYCCITTVISVNCYNYFFQFTPQVPYPYPDAGARAAELQPAGLVGSAHQEAAQQEYDQSICCGGLDHQAFHRKGSVQLCRARR